MVEVDTSFKVIVAGSRGFDDYPLLEATLDSYIGEHLEVLDVEIVSGGATGADTLGERYAKNRGDILKVFPAEWRKYGKGAGYIRNKQMAEYADHLVVFWDGFSKGSLGMIRDAEKAGIPVKVVNYERVGSNDDRS